MLIDHLKIEFVTIKLHLCNTFKKKKINNLWSLKLMK